MGAIIARNMSVFKSADPAWFYLHVMCQCSAHIVGVAGWGTILKLGSDSKGIAFHSHRNIVIALFSLATFSLWIWVDSFATDFWWLERADAVMPLLGYFAVPVGCGLAAYCKFGFVHLAAAGIFGVWHPALTLLLGNGEFASRCVLHMIDYLSTAASWLFSSVTLFGLNMCQFVPCLFVMSH